MVQLAAIQIQADRVRGSALRFTAHQLRPSPPRVKTAMERPAAPPCGRCAETATLIITAHAR